MEKNKIIFGFTLAFSIILEWFVRKGAMLLYGSNGFSLWPWIDNIMHFMWGLNIFLIFLLIFKWEPLDAFLAVFVFQMTWEAIEIIGDFAISQPEFMFDHFFFDGIKDTFVDLAGAFLGWRLFAWNKKESNPKKFRSFMINYTYASICLMLVGTMYFMYTLLSDLPFKSPNVFAVYWLIISAIIVSAYEFFRK